MTASNKDSPYFETKKLKTMLYPAFSIDPIQPQLFSEIFTYSLIVVLKLAKTPLYQLA